MPSAALGKSIVVGTRHDLKVIGMLEEFFYQLFDNATVSQIKSPLYPTSPSGCSQVRTNESFSFLDYSCETIEVVGTLKCPSGSWLLFSKPDYDIVGKLIDFAHQLHLVSPLSIR
jgi:hypothetical protein